MSGSIAQEAVKAAAFVQYVQRNAPGVGSFAGFTSRVTDALQQQAEKAGGVSPFAEVFDQVSLASSVTVFMRWLRFPVAISKAE